MFNRYNRRGGKPNFNKNKPSQRRAGLSAFELKQIVQNSKQSVNSEITKEAIINQFSDFNLVPTLLTNITNKGYTTPTPIQDKTIPQILDGKDLIGIANTGTGKTAAFLIPLVNKVMLDKSQKVLIISPTRELALQIETELKNFTRHTYIRQALCIGGASMFYQRRNLMNNPNFVIGTPGRIKDFVKQRAINLAAFNNVVLDEADTMVDIGFINEIKFFITLMAEKRQSLFFSATISNKTSEIIKSFVKNPVTVSVKKADATSNVKQELINTFGKPKIEVLHDLLISEGVSKTLIFGRTKREVEKLNKELVERGFRAAAIHGDKRQNQRQTILHKFKSDEINILLATDVASRGLDINNVSHVINYQAPESYEDYIHRIGRTGRGDKTGTAITFIES